MSTGFLADEGEGAERGRRGAATAAAGALLLGPGALLALGALAGLVQGRSGLVGALASLAIAAANPITLAGLVTLASGLRVARGRTTRVVLEADHLRIPGPGHPGLRAAAFEDGYDYAPDARALVVRVPYGRIAEVRRVTDPLEREILRGPAFHVVLRPGGGALRVHGHVLRGPGEEAGAPALLAEELRTCWVTDPERAVAITFHQLTLAGTTFPALPARLAGATLYASVADPDALVEALVARTTLARALPADADAAPLQVAEVERVPVLPPDPLPRRARPLLAREQADLVRAAVVGVVWWLAASLTALVGWETLAVVGGLAAAGDQLMRDANIVILVIPVVLVGFGCVPGPILAAVLDLAGAALRIHPLPRRFVLTGLVLTGPIWSLVCLGLVSGGKS